MQYVGNTERGKDNCHADKAKGDNRRAPSAEGSIGRYAKDKSTGDACKCNAPRRNDVGEIGSK